MACHLWHHFSIRYSPTSHLDQPTITSNNNIVVNVFNKLDEPFLTWNGIQQRKNYWQDGTSGTMCPIVPGTNYTYKFQVKDQIGSYYYFPTTGMHKAAGGIGPINIHSRDLIPVPFDRPADDMDVMVGDWYIKGHKALKNILDGGRFIGRPNGIQINGKSNKVGDSIAQPVNTVESGKTYRCNIGLKTSINFRVQGHPLKLVEIEGSRTVQNVYDSVDVQVGQCMSVLVTANQEPKDYYTVVSSRFTKTPIQSVAIIRYANGKVGSASPTLPPPPPEGSAGIAWSNNQFCSFRWNLTSSTARPNPQGSYHYGRINITCSIKLSNSQSQVDGKLRFAVNGVSHVEPVDGTPVKLLEYFGVKGQLKYNLMKDEPSAAPKITLAPNVVNTTWRNFVEIIFENTEKTIQTWHLDGYSFFAVTIEQGKWSPAKRNNYNLIDAVSRHNIHIYPNSWAAVMLTLDNAGMLNLRSEM